MMKLNYLKQNLYNYVYDWSMEHKSNLLLFKSFRIANIKIVKNYYLSSCFGPPYKVNCYGNGDESAT